MIIELSYKVKYEYLNVYQMYGCRRNRKVILQLCDALNDSENKVIVCAASGNGVEKLKEKNKIL